MSEFRLERFEPPLSLPVIESGAVVLRPFEDGDVTMLMEASDDPYIPLITSLPAGGDRADALAFIDRQHERAAGGHGYSLAIATNDGERRAVGSIGLWLHEIANGRATAGYWIVMSARGAHRAGWALRGVVGFAFAELAIPRLQLYIEPWNVASVRTAAFAGFAFDVRLREWERIGDEQHDADCYSLLRTEWQAAGA